MSQGLCSADMVQERLVRTLRAEAAGTADRRFHPKPVLIVVERPNSSQNQIDSCIGTMAAAGTSRMADPTHELRELSQLQLSPIMLLFDQKGPVGL
jgi:hypothetical protein